MLKEIYLCGQKVEYKLNRKNVKNINLRIKSDGSINVSASPFVLQNTIDNFLLSKDKWIINALNKYKNKKVEPTHKYFEEDELVKYISDFCNRVYPYYQNYIGEYPKINFKKTKSRWGSCNPKTKTLCFSTNLVYAPSECVEYVVYHEFTHFLQPDHSSGFYKELSKVCPDWHNLRNKLKSVII